MSYIHPNPKSETLVSKLTSRVERSYTTDIEKYIDDNTVKFLVMETWNRQTRTKTQFMVCERHLMNGISYIFIDDSEVSASQIHSQLFNSISKDSDFFKSFKYYKFKSPRSYSDHLSRELPALVDKYVAEVIYLIHSSFNTSSNFRMYGNRLQSMIDEINLMNALRGSPTQLNFLSVLREKVLKKFNKEENHLVERNGRYLLEYKKLEDPSADITKIWGNETLKSIFFKDKYFNFMLVSHPNITMEVFKIVAVTSPYYAFNNPAIAMLNLEDPHPLISHALQIFTKEY